MVVPNRRTLVNALPVRFTIIGEPASKANSRRFLRPGMLIKSQKALDYSDAFNLQCPYLREPSVNKILVSMKIFYSSLRPDLDESLILDLMQGKLYKNDRQVKQKIISHGLDRGNARAIIQVEEVDDAFDLFDLVFIDQRPA